MPVLTYLEAISDALRFEMERDDRVFLLGEDIGVYEGAFKVTKGFLKDFGERRVIDTPVSESAIVGASVGAALAGLRPVAEMQFADFVSCAYSMLVQMAAKTHFRWNAPVPMVVRCPTGGGVSGGPFHSQSPEVAYCHTPGLKVVAPSTPADAKGLLLSAIRDPNPVLFMEYKYLYRRAKAEVPAGDHTVPIGKAAVVRPGRHATVVTYGSMAPRCLEVAEAFAAKGRDLEVIDLRTLSPLDMDTVLASVDKTARLAVVHEDTRTLGIGAEIACQVGEAAFECLDAPFLRITAPDTPVPYSPILEEAFIPSTHRITEGLERLLAY